ncbi:Uma2 family endonuclease [Streptomyces sp. NPDC037389]|uniref:Uma2 family endonuclease n=1 Tax=Streptomyces sp. NPDC037389 TaxID=3155369 RepID=UPI0033CAB4BE
MTLADAERGMTLLRRAAEAAEAATGPRAEIIHGVLVLAPRLTGKQAGIINNLYDQLRLTLPERLRLFQVASVPMPGDPDDYTTPDLLVCDAGFADSDDWLADPGDVELVVEVVSKGNSTKDTRELVGWYADAGIPAYLLIDPRNGSWTLCTLPRDGEFQARRHGLYGEDAELSGLGVKITTEGLARYDK